MGPCEVRTEVRRTNHSHVWCRMRIVSQATDHGRTGTPVVNASGYAPFRLPRAGRRRRSPALRIRLSAGAGLSHRGAASASSARQRRSIRRAREVEHRDERNAPWSVCVPRRRSGGHVSGRHRHRRQIARRGTRSTCPRSWLRAKHPARERRAQGSGPGVPHGSDRVLLVHGLTRDTEQVTEPLPGDAALLVRVRDRIGQRAVSGSAEV